MKGNKVRWILGGIALLIWGSIAYQFAGFVTENEQDEQPPQIAPALLHPAERFVYKPEGRDPFQYVVPVRIRVRKDTTVTPKKVWMPPPLKLSGVVLNKKKKTVMLEAGDGNVFFLQEGDTVRGVKLLKIKDQVVTYRYQGKSGEWSLERH